MCDLTLDLNYLTLRVYVGTILECSNGILQMKGNKRNINNYFMTKHNCGVICENIAYCATNCVIRDQLFSQV